MSYLDHVIFERVAWRDADHPALEAELVSSITHNLAECTPFRRLEEAGIRLPTGEAVIPSYLFKSRSIKHDQLDPRRAKACMSSGTLGSKSIVLRDDRTLERFVGTVSYGIEHFLGTHDRRRAFVIGPTAEEAGDLWFSYVLSLVDVLYETAFYVTSGRPDFASLYSDLADENFYQPILVSPPALMMDFVRYLDHAGLALDLGRKDALLITAGGWKSRALDEIPQREFRLECGSRFNLDPSSIRDSFNMVELNTVLFECAHHRMHVPPWLRVVVIDPATMQEVEGDGVLCFIDPTAASYPCSILSEDIGRIVRESCPCGYGSPSILFRRRVKSNEQRGCGMKMSKFSEA